ncbi:MAG: DMT family transporter [Syntrophomonadaceae bacterium]|nr:DMT family transporter [Syntrophomonadaceae bacterium]
MAPNSMRPKAELYLLGVAFIWGTTFVLVKAALYYIGPLTFLAIRFILAAAFIGFVSRQHLPMMNWTTFKSGLILGLFLIIGYGFQTIGLQYTSASNAAFITGLSVVIVPIIISIYTLKLPPWGTILGIITASTGLFLLSVTAALEISFGDLLELICAFGFAFQIVMVSYYSSRHNPACLALVQTLTTGVGCLIPALFLEPWPPLINAVVLQALIITVVFATALAYLIQNVMQPYTTPTRTAVIFITEPLFAAAFAHMWAGEYLTTRALWGCLLIIAGMLLTELNFSFFRLSLLRKIYTR